MTDVLIRRGRDSSICVHREKAMWGRSKKVAVCKPRRQASGETSPANTLILIFQTLEMWEMSVGFCYGSPSTRRQGTWHPHLLSISPSHIPQWSFHHSGRGCQAQQSGRHTRKGVPLSWSDYQTSEVGILDVLPLTFKEGAMMVLRIFSYSMGRRRKETLHFPPTRFTCPVIPHTAQLLAVVVVPMPIVPNASSQ